MTSKDYKRILGRHRFLCVLLGLYFSWLLSFPLLGPSLIAFAEGKGMDGAGIGTTFALFHGLSLVGYGVWGRRRFVGLATKMWGKEERPLTDSACVEDAVDVAVMGFSCCACFGLTIAFVYAHYLLWAWIALVLGLVSGPFVITCASKMARTIPLHERGRTFAFSMAAANIGLYIHDALLIHIEPILAMYVSSVWLLIALLTLYFYRRQLPSMCVGSESASRSTVTEVKHVQGLQPQRLFLSLAVLIAATSIVGGFAHRVIFPSLTLPGDVHRFYDALPYVIMCFMSGQIADSIGRRPLVNYGFLFLGLSMPAMSLLSGIPGYLVTQTLIQSAYAFIDVFLWVSIADIAPKDRQSSYYGVGLGLNVCLIFAGMLFVERLLPAGGSGFSNISMVAVVILFFGVLGLVGLEETLTQEGAAVQDGEILGDAAAEASASNFLDAQPFTTGLLLKKPSYRVEAAIDHYVLNLMATEYALTRRELEVVVLLLRGLANGEIQEKLRISEGTLKTHLRHIFQKLEVCNRKELLVSFTRFLASYRDSGNQAEFH